MEILNKLKIVVVAMLVIALGACEEDMEKTMISGDITESVLNDPDSSDYTLTFENADEQFNTFSWSATDFGFEASITYTLQMDTVGGAWQKPVNLGTTQTLSLSPSVSTVNAALLGKGVAPDVPAEVMFRVMATVNPNVDPVYSNEITATVTPYEVSFPPIYVIGDAQGWDLNSALELTSTGPGIYEGVGLFQEAGKFRFFATPSWDAEQWNADFFAGGDVPEILVHAADGDANFIFEGANGVYKIVVDLNNQAITLEEGEMPTLFVIGEAQGWDLANAAELSFLGGTRFEGTADLQQDTKFRFFEKADWNATQYGFSHFADGTVPAELTDGADGDSNFLFTGATGSYSFVVDLNAKTIELEAASAYPASLYIVGDDQGWTFTNQLETISDGVYKGSATFSNGSNFRFFEEVDNWSDDFSFSDFTSVPADFIAVGDGDDNFQFSGTDGVYTVTVDLVNQSITLEAGATYPETLFLVGDPDWAFNNQLTAQGNGVYTGSADFSNGNTFRFFEEADNWTDDFRYAYFTGGVSSDLEAAGDGDDNFRFIGTDGTYNVRVDLDAKTVELSQ